MLEDFGQRFLRRFPKIHIHFLPARRHLGDCLFSELIMPVYLTVRRTPALTELLSSVMSHLSSEPSRTSAGGETCKIEPTRSVYRKREHYGRGGTWSIRLLFFIYKSTRGPQASTSVTDVTEMLYCAIMFMVSHCF